MEDKFWQSSDDYVLGRNDGRADMKREIIKLIQQASKATCDKDSIAAKMCAAVVEMLEREAKV